MSTVGIAAIAVGLCGFFGAGYGYKTASDAKDDKKKKIYAGLAIAMCFVMLVGVAFLFMSGPSKPSGANVPKSPQNLLPNDPRLLANLENRQTSALDTIRLKQDKIASGLEEQLKYLRR